MSQDTCPLDRHRNTSMSNSMEHLLEYLSMDLLAHNGTSRCAYLPACRWGALAAARSSAAELLQLPEGTAWQGILAAAEQQCPDLYARSVDNQLLLQRHFATCDGSPGGI